MANNKPIKVTIEYHHKRGDTVYFVMFDMLQVTTVKMVIAIINGNDTTDDNKVAYVVDETKIKRPKKKKYERDTRFENNFSVGELFKTPDEAVASLLKTDEGDGEDKTGN